MAPMEGFKGSERGSLGDGTQGDWSQSGTRQDDDFQGQLQGSSRDTSAAGRDVSGGLGSQTGAGDSQAHGWNRPDDAGTSAPGTVGGPSNTAWSGTAYNSKDTQISGSTFGPTGAGTIGAFSATDTDGTKPSNFSQEQRQEADDRHSATEGWTQQAQKWVSQAQDAAKNAAQVTQDYARDLRGQAGDAATVAIDELSETVRRNPTQALLVGFGVGCLIGLLIPRR